MNGGFFSRMFPSTPDPRPCFLFDLRHSNFGFSAIGPGSLSHWTKVQCTRLPLFARRHGGAIFFVFRPKSLKRKL